MEKLLTPEDLALITGLALQTIYNRRTNGGSLPRCINTGRLIRFHPRDVEVWFSTLYEDAQPLICKMEKREEGARESAPRRRGRPTKAEQVRRRKLVENL